MYTFKECLREENSTQTDRAGELLYSFLPAYLPNTVEPLYNGHIGTQHFVHYSEVSLTQGLLVYFW